MAVMAFARDPFLLLITAPGQTTGTSIFPLLRSMPPSLFAFAWRVAGETEKLLD